MEPEDNEDRDSHMDSEEGKYSQNQSQWTPDGNWGTTDMTWNPAEEAFSRSNGTSRPSSALGNQQNYGRRRKKPYRSSRSSSQSSSSENSDDDGDEPNRMDDDDEPERMYSDADNEAEAAISRMLAGRLSLDSSDRNRLPPVPRNRRARRSNGLEGALYHRGRGQSLDPARFRSDMEGNFSISRSPLRSRSLGDSSERSKSRKRTKHFQRIPGWASDSGMDDAYPHRQSSAEDSTHIPTPDHRRVHHHSRVGGHHARRSKPSRPRSRPSYYGPLPSMSGTPSTSGDSFDLSGFRDAFEADVRPPTSFVFGNQAPTSISQNAFNVYMGEEPFFEPSRGDIIILQPPQRGRKQNNFHPSCVRTFSERFGFGPSGDMIVRIGTYARQPYGEAVSYIPYRILELYRRQHEVWKFLGDAHSEVDIGEKRRMSGLDTPPYRGRSGQNCNIVPNWGDFIIHQDNIRHSEQGHQSTRDLIEWWTPYLPEEVNRLYPHNTILLRPYVRDPNFFRTRLRWLRKDIIRWDIPSGGGSEQGVISQVWPESIVHDGPHPGFSDPLEVLGPHRVGVTVINPPGSQEQEETAAWPLESTFFLNSRTDLSLYNHLSNEEREALNTEPWGSIEMYIYFAGVPPANGWTFWGRSRHICDTTLPQDTSS